MIKEVTTVQELKKSVNEGTEVIVVREALVHKLQPLLGVMKLSEYKLNNLITFLLTTGTILVGLLSFSPVTGGISGLTAFLASNPMVICFAMTNQMQVGMIVGTLILATSIGVSLVVEIVRNYEIEAAIEGVEIKLKVKREKDTLN